MVTRVFLIAMVFLTFLGASNCGVKRLKPDTGVSAVVAGDSTALVEGCGNQPVAGFTYCRKQEGDATGEKLWFHAPPAECPGDDPCVSLKIYRQGEEPLGFVFPQGTVKLGVEWKRLTGKNTFDRLDRGFWPYDYTIRWLGEDKREHVTFVDGEVRLVVFTADYVPLHEARDDPNFAWKWSEGDCLFAMTTGGRASVFCGDEPDGK